MKFEKGDIVLFYMDCPTCVVLVPIDGKGHSRCDKCGAELVVDPSAMTVAAD